jgi:hypothetical protein
LVGVNTPKPVATFQPSNTVVSTVERIVMTITERTRRALDNTAWQEREPWTEPHSHNFSGSTPVWVQCDTLTHCPSVCDCLPGEPCATVA